MHVKQHKSVYLAMLVLVRATNYSAYDLGMWVQHILNGIIDPLLTQAKLPPAINTWKYAHDFYAMVEYLTYQVSHLTPARQPAT